METSSCRTFVVFYASYLWIPRFIIFSIMKNYRENYTNYMYYGNYISENNPSTWIVPCTGLCSVTTAIGWASFRISCPSALS